MLQGLKVIFLSLFLTTAAGALFGLLIGALTEQYLLWSALIGALGAGFGLAVAYGFLPES